MFNNAFDSAFDNAKRLLIGILLGSALVFSVPAQAGVDVLSIQYSHVDKHASLAPEAIGKDPIALSNYLTSPYSTPVEKARSIYFWIIQNIRYDAEGYLAKEYASKSVDEILESKNGICDGFAKVFQALADHAGMEVISIEGRVKTIDNGDDWPEDRGNHVWNALRVNGEWKIIDSTWASGFVRKDGFKPQPNHFFFLASPESLLTSHFDLKDTFGLQAKHKLTLKEFLSLEQSPPSILQVGFEGEAVLAALRRKTFEGLVSTYDHPFGTLKVNQAPVVKHLNKPEEITFDLESNQFSEIAVFNNNNMDFVEPDKGRFVFKYTPKENGPVLVAGKKISDATYTGVLQYTAR